MAEARIDLSKLAQDLLNWEKKRRELDALERAIKDAVLQLRKTQTVGNVRATYSNPRRSYDYEGPVKDLLEAEETSDESKAWLRGTIACYTKPVVDWRTVCKEARIEPVVTPGSGPGSVSIKLLG